MELVQREPLGRRVERGRRARSRRRPARCRGACVRASTPAARRARARSPASRAAGPGSARSTRAARRAARIGSKCAPRREICSPRRFVMLERVAVRGRPDRLHHVPEVEASGLEPSVAEDRQRGEAGGERRDRGPETGGGSRARALLDQLAPSPAEYRPRSRALVACAASGGDSRRAARGRRRAGAAPPRARPRRPAERAARSRRRRAARAPPACRRSRPASPHASAWNTLFGITRSAFADVPKIPSAQPARWSSSGSRSYSTHGTHSTFGGRARAARESSWPLPTTAEAELRRAPRRLEDRLEAVQRDQLADEQARDGSAASNRDGRPAPPRRRGRPRCARAACPRARRRWRRLRVSATTRSAARKRGRSIARKRPRRDASRGEAPAVGDERVGERDEWVEHDRLSARRAPGRGKVEVPRVADDEHVEVGVAPGAAAPARPARAAPQRRLRHSICARRPPTPGRAAPRRRRPPGAGTRSPGRFADTSRSYVPK